MLVVSVRKVCAYDLAEFIMNCIIFALVADFVSMNDLRQKQKQANKHPPPKKKTNKKTNNKKTKPPPPPPKKARKKLIVDN